MLNIDTIDENIAQSSLPSLQEIAKLSLSERHKLLRPLIQEIAEDVNNDPELDLFSEIEGEGLENDDVHETQYFHTNNISFITCPL